MRVGYEPVYLRRRMPNPTSPIRPVANATSELGSGTRVIVPLRKMMSESVL